MILLQGIRPLPRTEDAIPTSIPFTSNCGDLSNTDGYRSEFHCDRCGNGYRSVYRRHFPSREEALQAAQAAAAEQQVPGSTEGIRYQDQAGGWHDETAQGNDRPRAKVVE